MHQPLTGSEKPPPIRVGVTGFNAFEAKPSQETQEVPNWILLESLPPYQMFLAEKRTTSQRSQDFYEAYCEWHRAKGYWPNETPLGKSME